MYEFNHEAVKLLTQQSFQSAVRYTHMQPDNSTNMSNLPQHDLHDRGSLSLPPLGFLSLDKRRRVVPGQRNAPAHRTSRESAAHYARSARREPAELAGQSRRGMPAMQGRASHGWSAGCGAGEASSGGGASLARSASFAGCARLGSLELVDPVHDSPRCQGKSK